MNNSNLLFVFTDLTKPGQPQVSPAATTPGSISTSPLRALGDNPLALPGTSARSVSPLTALQMSTRVNLKVPPPAAGQSVSGLPISRPIIGLPSGPRMGTRLSPLRERMSPTEEFEHPRPAPVPAPPTSTSPTGNSTNPRAPTP